MSADRCQQIYRGYLHAIRAETAPDAIRALMATAACDGHVRDLGAVRAAVRKHIGDVPMRRIESGTEDRETDRRALQALMHHHEWIDGEIAWALPAWRRVVHWAFGTGWAAFLERNARRSSSRA